MTRLLRSTDYCVSTQERWDRKDKPGFGPVNMGAAVSSVPNFLRLAKSSLVDREEDESLEPARSGLWLCSSRPFLLSPDSCPPTDSSSSSTENDELPSKLIFCTRAKQWRQTLVLPLFTRKQQYNDPTMFRDKTVLQSKIIDLEFGWLIIHGFYLHPDLHWRAAG